MSFRNAAAGIVWFLKRERNARIELLAAFAVIAAGMSFGLDRWEWCVLLVVIAAVLVAEVFNTALELLVDLAEPEWNPLAGQVKDIAAAAVLMIVIVAAVIGLVIFTPHLLEIFSKW